MKRNSHLAADNPRPVARLVMRREALCLAAVLTVGTILRLVVLSRSAVEHFDEGVYASNIYFGPPEYAYPMQRFFGPPLLPALIETGMVAGLPPNLAALLPNFLAGCGTIVALWWFGRSWFGPPVGIAAAALAALSDFHIAYSATALTDVLLGLWLLLAVDALARSIVIGDLRWAVGGGIFSGLAWWTKYNGWLPLAIAAAAIPLLWLFLRPPGRQLQVWLGCYAVTAAVAAAVWAPYYLSLQSQGGYGPIAANHAKYMIGFAGWFDSVFRQIAAQNVMEGLFSKLAVVASLALPALLVRRRSRECLGLVGAGFVGGVLAVLLTSVFVVGIGALIGLIRVCIANRHPDRDDEKWKRRAIGLVLLAVWWSGLLLATPCYTPYPRLVLPWLLAAWLGMALNCADVLSYDDAQPAVQRSSSWGLLVGAAFALGIGVLSLFVLSRQPRPYLAAERWGLERIARQVRAASTTDQPWAIYVYGEPALYFQLRAAGEEFVGAANNIPTAAATPEGAIAPTFLMVGPHAQRDPQFRQQWAAAKDHWELVQTYAYTPSAIVWLDSNDPRQPPPLGKSAEEAVRLYRLRP